MDDAARRSFEELRDKSKTQAEKWYWELSLVEKIEPLRGYIEQQGYRHPADCIASTLRRWGREERKFEDMDALDAAIRREHPKLEKGSTKSRS